MSQNSPKESHGGKTRMAHFQRLLYNSFFFMARAFSESLFLNMKLETGSSEKSFEEDYRLTPLDTPTTPPPDLIQLESPDEAFDSYLKCHPLITGYFSSQLSEICAACYSNVSGLHLEGPQSLLAPFSRAIDRIQGRMVDSICFGIVQGDDFLL